MLSQDWCRWSRESDYRFLITEFTKETGDRITISEQRNFCLSYIFHILVQRRNKIKPFESATEYFFHYVSVTPLHQLDDSVFYLISTRKSADLNNPINTESLRRTLSGIYSLGVLSHVRDQVKGVVTNHKEYDIMKFTDLKALTFDAQYINSLQEEGFPQDLWQQYFTPELYNGHWLGNK